MIVLDKLPEQTSALRHIEYELIDNVGKTIKLPNEYVPSFECFFKRHTPTVMGSLLYIDRLDLSKQIDLKTSSVKVYYIDLFNKMFFRTFKIININEIKSENGLKMFEFKLRDSVSYFLDNLYISKSFTGSRVSALSQIFSEYNLSSKLTETKLKFQTEDDGIKGNLVLNKNLSVLDFFEKEFHRIGYSFYQDKLGMYVKNKENLLPGKIPEITAAFSQRITNQFYKNKIYEIITVPTSKEEIDKQPKQQSFYYDIEKRQMVSINTNIGSLQSEITLNKDNSDIQETVGFKAKFQNRSDSAQQKSEIIDQFLKLSTSKIVVNGYVDNDINKIVDLEILGEKGNNKSHLAGDIVSSGKYIILSVIDKIVADKMLQLIEVGRSDTGKVGKA
jgi:hypothetical protein